MLIEYRAEDPAIPIKRLHKMSVKQALKEMEAVGLKLERNGKFLPQQHFMVFRRALPWIIKLRDGQFVEVTG